MSLFRPLLALSVLVALGACKHTPTDPTNKNVTTTLSCDKAGGGTIGCDIAIPTGATKLRITFVSHDCDAHGNIITISQPATITLTEDACYETVPKTVEIPGPFSAAHLNMKVTSKYIYNQPQLRLSGTASPWTVNFEDGGDVDFNDAILTVEAI
jgi:hypothetical protein